MELTSAVAGSVLAVDTALTSIAKMINIAKDTTGHFRDIAPSSVTRLTDVSPVTVVTKDLLNNPEIKLILNSLLSMNIGVYSMAINIMTKVKDIEVVRILDKLNPNRDETGFLLSEKATRAARESFRHISLEAAHYALPTRSRALETSHGDDVTNVITNVYNNVQAPKAAGGGIDAKVDLNELVNLSVGRLVNINIELTKESGSDAGKNISVTVPISFRLLVSSVPNDAVIGALSYKHHSDSFIDRWHDWRSGRINGLRDMIFCQDLITEYRRAVTSDPNKILQEVTRRSGNAKRYGMLTGNPSLASATSFWVISDTVARQIESRLDGPLENSRIREKVFEAGKAMIIAVVNTSWETVTFYFRDLAKGSQFGFRELESKVGKGSGPDVSDIMKAMMAGQPPSF